MSRLFTTEQKALLRAPSLRLNVLMSFFLDEGTYRFCDDIIDRNDGVNTYIGAQPLASTIDIRSGKDLSAEPVTLILDGNKMTQAGIQDPARVLADIMGYLHQQRRVDISFGLSYPDQSEINMVIPVAALKINYCRWIDETIDIMDPTGDVTAKLEIVMDSLAARYQRSPFRTRSHADQLEIDPTDMFFSFTADASNTEKTLHWGKKSSIGGVRGGGGFIGGAVAFITANNGGSGGGGGGGSYSSGVSGGGGGSGISLDTNNL
jgi:hypothetical protein